MTIAKKPIPVIERARGCWNCTSYAHGEMALQHMQECKKKEIAAKIAVLGYVPTYGRLGDMENPNYDPNHEEDARFAAWDHLVKSNQIGICMAGLSTDFVHHKHLCEKWRGCQGSGVATEGAKMDLLPEELRDRYGR